MQRADADAALDGMCTTLTAAVTHGKDLILGHVGDSRATTAAGETGKANA
jgi:serine/threonine protein phosphatase PrpC